MSFLHKGKHVMLILLLSVATNCLATKKGRDIKCCREIPLIPEKIVSHNLPINIIKVEVGNVRW